MLEKIDVLSLWELAHRWHETDPNMTDPTALPLPIQDSLRALTHALFHNELTMCSEIGVEYWNRSHAVSFNNFIPDDFDKSRSKEEQWEQYCKFIDIKVEPHEKAVKNFEQCFKHRKFNRQELDSVYIPRYSLGEWCFKHHHSFPKFWFSPEDIKAVKHEFDKKNQDSPSTTTDVTLFSGRHGPSHLDEFLCQAIASTLWEIYPTMTITSIIKHRAIQIYGNGALYTERTIRGWIKHLDPRPEAKRGGRPPKKPN